jgi:uncharacterized protein (DUF952 family)
VLIYKILLPPEWAELDAAGRFDGSPFDVESGFIHCSSRAQVAAVAKRVFGDQPALVVAAVDTDALGDPVRWEAASDGLHYPHIYGTLPRHAVVAAYPVPGADAVEDVLPPE